MNTAPAAPKSLSVSSQSASVERLFKRMLPSAVDGGSARAPPHNTLTATGIDLFEALVAGASINVAHAAAPSYEHDMYAIHADDAEDYGGGKLKLQAPWSSDRAPSSRASSAYGRSTPHSHVRAHFAASSSSSQRKRPDSSLSFFSASASRPASGASSTPFSQLFFGSQNKPCVSGVSSISEWTTGSSSASSSKYRSKARQSAVFRSPIIACAMQSSGVAGAAHALQPHGREPKSAAIAAAFATLESLCDNPSLADLRPALSRSIRELSVGVYCFREWLGFNSSNEAVPYFELLKQAGQQVVHARAALGTERSIAAELQQQVH